MQILPTNYHSFLLVIVTNLTPFQSRRCLSKGGLTEGSKLVLQNNHRGYGMQAAGRVSTVSGEMSLVMSNCCSLVMTDATGARLLYRGQERSES